MLRDYFSATSAYAKIRKYQKSQWTGCFQFLWVQAEWHVNSDKENRHESADRWLQCGLNMVNIVMELKVVSYGI